MCFTGFMVRGVLISLLLVPVIKDTALERNSMDNYRPIALNSILSKVLERILQTRLEIFLELITCLVLKKKHGTEMCSYALNEIIAKYDGHTSVLLTCFIDESTVFSRINHENVFFK